MPILSDEAVDGFFKVALRALEREHTLVCSAIKAARDQHSSLYENAARLPGLGCQPERSAAWAICRALLEENFSAKYGLEVLCDAPYPGSREQSDVLLIRREPTVVVACVEIKWADYPISRVRDDAEKMRRLCPGREARRFVLVYGVERPGHGMADLVTGLTALGLRTEETWYGPHGNSEALRFYAVLAEANV